jgi:hypothetical protein
MRTAFSISVPEKLSGEYSYRRFTPFAMTGASQLTDELCRVRRDFDDPVHVGTEHNFRCSVDVEL